jgi:hypothetical protein
MRVSLNYKVCKELFIRIYQQCPDEIVPNKSTSTTLRNTPLTYKHDSAGSFSITENQLNRVYVRARDYAKLYWSTCSVLFRPDTVYQATNSRPYFWQFHVFQRVYMKDYLRYSCFVTEFGYNKRRL